MYHIVDTVLRKDPDSNENAITNVFEEFIGCAVSSSIASLTFTFQLLHFLAIWPRFKSNSKGFYREDSQKGDQSFFEHEPVQSQHELFEAVHFCQRWNKRQGRVWSINQVKIP
jgi:hypothetical protein